MTAEQLEELLNLLNSPYEGRSDAEFQLKQLGPSLARKVIAAEKLVEALSGIIEVGKTGYHSISGDWLVSRKLMTAASNALTAYREASK